MSGVGIISITTPTIKKRGITFLDICLLIAQVLSPSRILMCSPGPMTKRPTLQTGYCRGTNLIVPLNLWGDYLTVTSVVLIGTTPDLDL